MAENYPNLTTLQPPKNEPHHLADLKIDSVKIINRGKAALLISGRFTNGCSRLQKADHLLQGDTLTISITAWQPADKMCTQVMKPFSYIFDKAAAQKLKEVSEVRINQHHFSIHP